MLRSKAFLAVVLIAAGLSTGCSSLASLQFKRAQQIDKQGKTEKALAEYAAVLSRVPQRDAHLRSQVYFRMGECLYRLDRLNEAFAAFQKSAEADNSNALAHLRLGEIYLAGGAPDRAGEQAHTVLQLASANIDGLALLGAASSAAGNNNLALEAFTRVLESDPKRVTVSVALADVYNREDRIEEARLVLRKATAAQPTSSLPWLALGRLEEQEGNVAAAEESYRHAASAEDTVETNLRLAQFLERTARVDEAESVLLRVDRLRPIMPTALADFQFQAGKPATALSRYTTALRSPRLEQRVFRTVLPWSEPKRVYSTEVAQSRSALAARVIEADLQVAKQAGREDSSARNSTAVARLHLNEYRAELDPATLATLQAEIALADNDAESAATFAGKAIALAPESAAARYVSGIALLRNGDPAGARSEWAEVLNSDSGYVPARLALAEDAFSTGDLAGAEQYVVPAVREEPANVAALNLFARVLLGQKRYGSAAVIARRAAVLDSDSAEPRIILGRVALAEDNIGAALGEFERAISLEPYSEEALEGLTHIYRRGSITRSMLANLERIAQTEPASAPLMDIAGRIYNEHGWYGDARRCFARALAIDSHRVSAAAMLAALQAKSGDYAAAVAAGTKLGDSRASLLNATQAQDRADVATAIREYEQAIRQGDTSGVAANNLAWIFAERGQSLDQALMLANKARSLAPDNPSVLDTLGTVHLKRREYSDAIAVLKQAERLAMQKRFPEYERKAIRQHLSDAYTRAGQNMESAALQNDAPRQARSR